MDLSLYFTYLMISILASASLGPSVLLAASNSINFGRKMALVGVFGHVGAILTLAIISASSLGFILMSSKFTYLIIKYLGASYLIFLGIKLWRNKGVFRLAKHNNITPSSINLFSNSFILGLSNPKALLFFTALFPQFIHADQALFPQFTLLISTSLINAFIFTSFYVLIAYKCKGFLLKQANGQLISRITGSFFIGFAGSLIFSN
ncbi:LysE family translocator [Pseudoalteromonas denitrificans]|nr:LysE family translocator [Pseudoalteromonas denitrificans]